MKTSMKKSVLVGTMALTLAFGGAVAGASSPTFTDSVQGAIGQLVTKVAGWAGYQVATVAEDQEAGVESHVASKFNDAKNTVASKYSTEVANGNRAVTDHATAVKNEVTTVAEQSTANAVAAIEQSVAAEVSEGKGEIDQAAKDKANALLQQNNVPAAPAHPER